VARMRVLNYLLQWDSSSWSPQVLGHLRVANLWTEFSARDRYAVARNVKECKNPSKTLVAATFEKAKLTFLPKPRFGTVRSVFESTRPDHLKFLQHHRLHCRWYLISAYRNSIIILRVISFGVAGSQTAVKGLKIRCPQGRAGSTPALSTIANLTSRLPST